MAMLSLKQDFPDIADEIVTAANSHAALQEALADYEHACKQMVDEDIRSSDREQWREIRAELITEIRRIVLCLDH